MGYLSTIPGLLLLLVCLSTMNYFGSKNIADLKVSYSVMVF